MIGTLEASGLMREMTERLGRGRGARRRVPAGTRGLPGRPGRDRRGARDRRRLRRWHARPGEVPARARRSGARAGAWGEPAGRRGPGRAGAPGPPPAEPAPASAPPLRPRRNPDHCRDTRYLSSPEGANPT